MTILTTKTTACRRYYKNFSLFARGAGAILGLTLIFPFLSIAGTPDIQAGPPLQILRGEQRLLKIPALVRYSVGSDIVRIITGPSSLGTKFSETLLIKGVTRGHTDLWVWTRDGRAEFRNIEVITPPSSEKKPLPVALSQGLETLQEVEVIATQTGFSLRGPIRSLEEAKRVATLSAAFPNLIHDDTLLTDDLAREGQRRIENGLAKSGNPHDLRTENFEGQVVVAGTLQRAIDRPRVERVIREYFPKVTWQIYTLPDSDPTIYVRVCLLELHKKQFQNLGLSWPARQEGAFRILRSGIQTPLQLDIALQTLAGEGAVRILSNPELVLRVPGEAELFAGGELPIKTNTQYSSQLQWKSFGLSLKLKTTHFAGKKLRLEILSEVSHLDSEIALDAVPGIQANRLKTMVDAEFGKPLFLSGLIQNGMRKQVRGLPVLKDIPVLGALFGSEDFQEQNSELVAILIPELETPVVRTRRAESVAILPSSLEEDPAFFFGPRSNPSSSLVSPKPSFDLFPFAWGGK